MLTLKLGNFGTGVSHTLSELFTCVHFLVRLLSLWHVPHFLSQFYILTVLGIDFIILETCIVYIVTKLISWKPVLLLRFFLIRNFGYKTLFQTIFKKPWRKDLGLLKKKLIVWKISQASRLNLMHLWFNSRMSNFQTAY